MIASQLLPRHPSTTSSRTPPLNLRGCLAGTVSLVLHPRPRPHHPIITLAPALALALTTLYHHPLSSPSIITRCVCIWKYIKFPLNGADNVFYGQRLMTIDSEPHLAQMAPTCVICVA